jgi:hypothetical protein
MKTPIRKLFPLNLKSLIQYNNKTINEMAKIKQLDEITTT